MIRLEAGHLADDLCRSLSSWSWVVGDKVLRSSCSMGLEAGLLPHGIQIANQFFPLKETDLVLLKDCQIGGPGRDRLALVQCLRSPTPQLPGIWLATGFLAPSTAGMKLPPIPLRTAGEINEAVLAALGACEFRLRQEIQKQDEIRARALSPIFRSLWSNKALADEMEREQKELKQLIQELPDGEVMTELQCGAEIIKLRLEVEHGQIHFHFAGTTPATQHSLPLAATSGIVRATVREWLKWPRTLTAACETLISMSTPSGCMLNPSSKVCCDARIVTSASLLKTAVESALHLWDRRSRRGLTNYFDARATFRFQGLAPLPVLVPSGSAAADSSEGQSFFDQRTCGSSFSPEKIESQGPLLVQKIEARESTEADLKFAGGPGLVLSLEILAEGELHWEAPPQFQLKLKKGQSPYQLPEIEVQRGSTALPLSDDGKLTLKPGDLVIMKSGSGGGLLSN